MLGTWYVVQYYASSEEALPYRCMQAVFTMSPFPLEITMNFTYSFTDDPLNEKLFGNITWTIPDPSLHAHWTHSEDICKEFFIIFLMKTRSNNNLLLVLLL